MNARDVQKLYSRYLEGKVLRKGNSRQNGENMGILLEYEWTHWVDVHANGSRDQFGPDGSALSLIRSHIVSMHRDIEEWCAPGDYPDACRRGLPPDVPRWYMARAGEIVPEAAQALKRIAASDEYAQYEQVCMTITDSEACAMENERNPEAARRILAVMRTNFERFHAEAERLSDGDGSDEWIRANAEALFDLRRYGRMADWTLRRMREECGRYERIHRAMAAGAPDCRGYAGAWCDGCGICHGANIVERANGQLAWT